MSKIKALLQLMRAEKPIGSFLLLWPCLWSLWTSTAGKPDLQLTIYIILGVIITRSAGCVINDIFDRDLDARVTRTKKRPLACNAINEQSAWTLFTLLSLAALTLAWKLEVLESAIPAGICIAIYPKCKRYLAIPQAWLAMTWGLSTIVVWQACKVEFSISIIWLFIVSSFWTLAFDTLYAMSDRHDDAKIGINSFALWLGDNDLIGIVLCYLSMLISWLYFSFSINSSFCTYGTTIALAIILLILRLARSKKPQACLLAFKANNWLGLYFWLLIFATFR